MTERNDSRDVSHLPECMYHPDLPDEIRNSPCACAALRACEQRLLNDIIQRAELTFRSDIINPIRDIIEPLLKTTNPPHNPKEP